MELLSAFIRRWQETHPGGRDQPVLLAVSGGMDSMVMAHLFLEAGIPFGMAHCNFQLRGEEADQDEALVAGWAQANKLPFFHTRFDTAAKAEEWKKSIQETARDLRYEWLEGIRREHQYAFIATAHHANDNAETLLINLFRGTGISGLHGIPEQNGRLIRPLLFASREAIAAYAAAAKVPYRDDSSNASDKYLRNAVRLKILPAIGEYFPEVADRLNESIRRFGQAEQLYQKEVVRQLRKIKDQRNNDIYIPVLKFRQLKPLETLCYELFKDYGFTAAQTEQLIRLADAGTGRYMESSTHKVIRDRNFLILTAKKTEDTSFISVAEAPCTVRTAQYDFLFSAPGHPENITEDASVACIDAGRLDFPLILRKWRTGDYFYPLGMGMKKKKLSRFFIDQKIPLHQKEDIWVLESAKKIVWVSGLRLDERFKIRPATQQLLKVEMRVH